MYVHVPVNTYMAAVNTDASELLRIKDDLQRSPFVGQGCWDLKSGADEVA